MFGGVAACAPCYCAVPMVDCTEFLDNYSDFRDGRLSADLGNGFEAHLQVCGSCARYDRVVGGGVQVFRSLPGLTPSPDFQARLLGRLYAVDRAAGRHGSGASLAVTLMICAALGIGAWVPALRSSSEPVMLPPIVAHAPYHDLSPVLMQTPAPALSAPVWLPQPGHYRQGLLLDNASPQATLAYRPAAYYLPR